MPSKPIHPYLVRSAIGLLVILPALGMVAGCDWRTPKPPAVVPGGLDLTQFSEGNDGWNPRQVDRGKLPVLDTVRTDSLWMEVLANGGEASRWRRKVRWSADDFPVLTWRWYPSRRLDSSGFSRKEGPAAVMAIDVTLASAFGFHKTVRYVWSARADRGKEYVGDGWHPKVVVLRDARDSLGPHLERVDVWADFVRLWGFQPRHQAMSIAIAVHDPDPRKSLLGRFGSIIALPGKESQ